MESNFINTLFPVAELSSTEMNEIAEALDKPAVKKYLKNWAIAGLQGLATGMPRVGESAEAYLQREAIIKGNLEVIEKLLVIQKVAPAAA